MFKHLLGPLDGSHLAEAALPAAMELAAQFNSEITLLRVTRVPYIATGMDGTSYADLIVNLRQQEHDEAEAYLRRIKGYLRQQGYIVHHDVLENEGIAQTILGVAEGHNIDTIVMSTHGRGGISRWMFGSVADKVLRQADIPVVLIRATEEVIEWELPDKLEKVAI
jgi:nucleotide-binding universal stress UspA family protein